MKAVINKAKEIIEFDKIDYRNHYVLAKDGCSSVLVADELGDYCYAANPRSSWLLDEVRTLVEYGRWDEYVFEDRADFYKKMAELALEAAKELS